MSPGREVLRGGRGVEPEDGVGDVELVLGRVGCGLQVVGREVAVEVWELPRELECDLTPGRGGELVEVGRVVLQGVAEAEEVEDALVAGVGAERRHRPGERAEPVELGRGGVCGDGGDVGGRGVARLRDPPAVRREGLEALLCVGAMSVF